MAECTNLKAKDQLKNNFESIECTSLTAKDQVKISPP